MILFNMQLKYISGKFKGIKIGEVNETLQMHFMDYYILLYFKSINYNIN